MIEFIQVHAEDFGPLGSVSFHLQRCGLVLIQGENRDTAAASSNGAGKSHIFKAITWCLFGDTVEGDRHDAIIRRGAKAASVSVLWTNGNIQWAVTRRKGKATAETLKLSCDGNDVTCATVQDSQAEIIKQLGLDFQTWRSTVLYGQGDLVRFADPDTTDAERKNILKRILRLDVLDKAQKQAGVRFKSAHIKCDGLESDMRAIEAELAGMASTRAFDDNINAFEADVKKLQAKVALAPRLEAVKLQLVGKIGELDSVKKDVAQMRRDAESERINMERFKSTARTAALHAADVQRQIDLISAGSCPTCGSPSDSPHVKSRIGALRQELTRYQEEQTAAVGSVSGCAELAKAKQLRADELEKTFDHSGDWNQKLGEVETKLRDVQQAQREIDQKAKAISRWRAEQAQILARTNELMQQKLGKSGELATLQEDLAHLDFWFKGFGNTGLPSLLMDSAMPAITERANHYLEVLSDGDITVSFDTQSKLKGGDLREKLAINWVIEGVEGVTPSGGQRKKISIATDLALMDLVVSREKAAIDLLMMDEVLDGLDAEGKSRVVDLLQELRQKRGSILVVSHDPGLSEMFETVANVVKKGGVSTLG